MNASIPFVVKSGEHSEWSTIGSKGIVIDFAQYSGIDVDEGCATATLKGSILSKEVGVTLAEKGMYTGMQFNESGWTTANPEIIALGNSNTVGAIPYFTSLVVELDL